MKVSREGVVLIKSFVGFRSRAVRGEDGHWVIGYGHTASAREGLTVAEPDAELLLQYDLLPVVKGLNRSIARSVNQHQFDALASFALSIGVDRFLGSDVLQRLNDGLPTQAADALIGWPAPVPLDAAARRRVAERALFNADPDQPVHLADLLTAPLPAQTAEPDTVETPVAAVAARAAAVATLLGEPAGTEEPPVASEAPSQARAPEPSAPTPATTAAATTEPAAPEPAATTDAHASPPTPVETVAPANGPFSSSMHLQRYAPYAAGMVGPLPVLTPPPALPPAAEPPPPADHGTPTVPVSAVAMSIKMEVVIEQEAPASDTPVVADPTVEPAAESVLSPATPSETMDAALVVENTLVTPFGTSAAAPIAAPALVLTPASTDPAPAEDRPVWPDTQREEPAGNQVPLFVEEPGLSVLRHEIESGTPARFEKSQTGAFLIMGGVGLLASAFSAAAFRLALQEPSPMGETTVVAWTLAVIGGVCVIVSSLNLYMRWGRARQDTAEPS